MSHENLPEEGGAIFHRPDDGVPGAWDQFDLERWVEPSPDVNMQSVLWDLQSWLETNDSKGRPTAEAETNRGAQSTLLNSYTQISPEQAREIIYDELVWQRRKLPRHDLKRSARRKTSASGISRFEGERLKRWIEWAKHKGWRSRQTEVTPEPEAEDIIDYEYANLINFPDTAWSMRREKLGLSARTRMADPAGRRIYNRTRQLRKETQKSNTNGESKKQIFIVGTNRADGLEVTQPIKRQPDTSLIAFREEQRQREIAGLETRNRALALAYVDQAYAAKVAPGYQFQNPLIPITLAFACAPISYELLAKYGFSKPIEYEREHVAVLLDRISLHPNWRTVQDAAEALDEQNYPRATRKLYELVDKAGIDYPRRIGKLKWGEEWDLDRTRFWIQVLHGVGLPLCFPGNGRDVSANIFEALKDNRHEFDTRYMIMRLSPHYEKPRTAMEGKIIQPPEELTDLVGHGFRLFRKLPVQAELPVHNYANVLRMTWAIANQPTTYNLAELFG